jgi:hypothetical protein
MKATTYSLIAATVLAAAVPVSVTAQQAEADTCQIVISGGQFSFNTVISAPIVLRLSEVSNDDRHRQAREEEPINSKPTKLEPVHIVASRRDPYPRNK